MKKTKQTKSKTGARKLVIKPEPVRPLTPEQAADVAGAFYPQTWCITCSCHC